MRLLLNWLLSAISLLIVSKVVPGFYLHGFKAALIAALVIGLVNATLGLFLKLITLPLTLLTLGIFWWVINALMLMFASTLLSPRFRGPRLLGGVLGSHRTLADQYGIEVVGAGGRTRVGLFVPVNRKAVNTPIFRNFLLRDVPIRIGDEPFPRYRPSETSEFLLSRPRQQQGNLRRSQE